MKVILSLVIAMTAATASAGEEKPEAQAKAKAAVEAKKAAAEQEKMLSAEELIKSTSDSLLSRIKSDDGTVKALPALHQVITEELLPHIAEKTISQQVLGPHWKKASVEQKKKFVDEFTTYLILFYAKAFSQYTNEKITFLPEQKLKSNTTIVKSVIERPNDAPISVDYRLKQTTKGNWLVVDIIVEGVSLVLSKRKEYSRMVAQEGLDSVTATLATKNEEALKGSS